MNTWIALLLTLSLAFAAQASEDGAVEGAAVVPAVVYIGLTPALVGNFGTGPKLRYFKADIALRVNGADAEARVTHHEPLIRNQLVMLFSQLTDASVATVEAKEALRQQALKQVQEVLSQEEGRPLVDDLLFNNLIIQ